MSINIDSDVLSSLFGNLDENITKIEKRFNVRVTANDNALTVLGVEDDVLKAEKAIEEIISLIKTGVKVDGFKVQRLLDMLEEGVISDAAELEKSIIAVNSKGKPIKCQTIAQKQYTDAIENNTVVFGVGPAGTGKTFLASALAAKYLKKGLVERIILTRPAIEAGEKLGFLPGDLQEKVDPYLRPLYDALDDMFGSEGYLKLVQRGLLEIAPLAYMRGRTLKKAFIILDEAQNTTREQMKMFLTRLGEGSKIVVNGDITQIDLPKGVKSGMIEAISILDNIDDIKIIRLTEKDIVRHELVSKIVTAYSKKTQEETRL